jgi:hypothetical protein
MSAAISRVLPTDDICRVARGGLALAVSFCFLFSACDRTRRSTSFKPPVRRILQAQPNPVPAGDLDQPLATTEISWNTGDGTIGDLYVKVNRSPESFLGSGAAGTVNVNWIQFDSTYEFRLYIKKHSKLLSKLDVTRDN